MSRKKNSFIETLQKQGIKKPVIEAFRDLDMKSFFDPIFKDLFYSDDPVPVGHGEKSDPQTALAKMINFLNPHEYFRILEIGTGSGYSTALLSKFAKEVVTVEYHEELALQAKERLRGLKIDNVRFLTGDILDYQGIPGMFDAILIFAAVERRPLNLLVHLVKSGLMIFPMGPAHQQQIIVVKNHADEESGELVKVGYHDFCVFTPLKGMYENYNEIKDDEEQQSGAAKVKSKSDQDK